MKLPGLPNTSAARQAVLVSSLMMAWQLAAKTTRDSLFLSVFPFTALPPVVGAAAVCSIAVAFFSTKLLHRYGPYRLIPAGFLAGAALHAAEWILFPMFPRPLAAFIYLHVLALGPVMLSGFWALASERFDPREARRRYGQITAFGTLGSLTGGLMAERVAVWSSSLDLLILLAVLQLACSLALFQFAPSHSTEKAYEVPSIPEMISGAPYLIGLALFVLLVSMSAAGLDFLFRAKAVATFGQGPGLTRFFAIFNTATSVMTFAAQASLSRIWMRRFGPGGTVSVLPVTVTGASLVSLFAPGPISISISRGLEQLLRGSFYRSGYELFYTPMPAAERRSAKAVIDIGADRLGEGLAAAAIQLFLVLPSEVSFRVVLGATAIWSGGAAWLAFRLDRAYVAVLEKGLAQQTVVIQPEEAEDAVTRSIVLRSGSSISAANMRDASVAHSPHPGDVTLRCLAELRSSDPLRARAMLLSIDLREPLLVPQVIKLLGRDETARAAHDALSRAVDQIAGQLTDRLADPAENEKIRRRIPRVLAASKSPLAWHGLFRQLRDDRFEIRQRCARALEKMLQANPEFRPQPSTVFEIVGNELAAGHNVLPNRMSRPAQSEGGEDPDFQLMDEVLRERATHLMAHVSILLGLVLPPQSVRLAFRALHTEDAKLRGVALEYLDSVLPKGVREQLAAQIEGPVARPGKAGSSAEEALANLVDESPSILARLEDLKLNAPSRKKSSGAPG
jgi:ATP:ADP antiporter, AAA family